MSNLDILNSKNQSFFLPIGGIGEIGGNNYLYSFKGEQIIVDAGISFADDSLPGVDITIPDPYIFLNPSIKPKAMILTHAHEDHVGGPAVISSVYMRKERPVLLRFLCHSSRNWDTSSSSSSMSLRGGTDASRGSFVAKKELKTARA